MAEHTSRQTCLRAALFAMPFTCIVLVGCSDFAVLLGVRTRLDKLPVTSITASIVTKGSPTPVIALAPGASARIVVVATTQDGKQLVTAGAGHGKVLLDSFVFTPTLVQLGKGGKVSMPADPRISDGKVAGIHIATVGHPDVVTDLDIAARYDAPFVANFSGANGTRGFDGSTGLDGMAGADAMQSPPDPTTGLSGFSGSGGNGGDGGRGGDGGNGGDGLPGAAVHVWLRLKPGADSVLQAKVTGGGHESYFLVAANGGSLKVTADGGAGGAGGDGGRGGSGGSGGSGSPNGSRGTDGLSGFGGSRGRDGAAGSISVSVDPAAQSFESVLSLSNKSGSGQPGPAPRVVIETVLPLW